jgi:hypothetical protein
MRFFDLVVVVDVVVDEFLRSDAVLYHFCM